MAVPLIPLETPNVDWQLAILAEDAVARIGELSGRISASSVRLPWQRRAAWSGYARAMQLQGIEIDEADIFSWACELTLPGRRRRVTVIDEFDAFAPWWSDLQSTGRASWKDDLPFTPTVRRELPRILQALEIQRQYALHSGAIAAWLSLPKLLYHLGLSQSPLPCLVAGSKSLRLLASVPEETVRAILKALASHADRGLETLDTMEAAHRASLRAIQGEYRPGKLPELLALSLSVALLSPARVAAALDLSIAGAGKLLERAATLGLVDEVSGRRSWKAYLTPDLAIGFGFRKSPVGRPRKEPPPLPQSRDLAAAFDSFDREMAEIEARLSRANRPAGGPGA